MLIILSIAYLLGFTLLIAALAYAEWRGEQFRQRADDRLDRHIEQLTRAPLIPQVYGRVLAR